MHEVAKILSAARRRLTAVRAAESAALAAVAAAAGALPVMLAWGLAYDHASVATVLCTLPLLAGLTLVARPAGRALGLTAPQRALLAGVLLSLSAGGLLGVLNGDYLHLPRAFWLLHVLASAAAGAVLGLLTRPGLLQTGALLDERLHLHERLATSAALLQTGQSDPMAKAVFAQSAAAAAARDAARLNLWARGRGTAGALLLTLLACLVLLLTPAVGPQASAEAIDSLSRQTQDMTPGQLLHLARQLQQTASREPEGTRQIQAAADAAQAGDTELLAQSLAVLAQLVEQGKVRLVKLPDALAEGTLRDDFGSGTPAADNAAANLAGNTPATGSSDRVDPNQSQLVFRPEYASIASNAAGNAPQASTARYVSFDQAWDDARAAASQALTTGEIPTRHRATVQQFFRAE